MAVNSLTALILTKIGKAQEALEFILIAEKVLAMLIELNVENKPHPRMQEYLRRKHQAQQDYVMKQQEVAGHRRHQLATTIKVEIFDINKEGEMKRLKTRQCTARKEANLSDNDGAPYANGQRAIFSQHADFRQNTHKSTIEEGEVFNKTPLSIDVHDTVDGDNESEFYQRQ